MMKQTADMRVFSGSGCRRLAVVLGCALAFAAVVNAATLIRTSSAATNRVGIVGTTGSEKLSPNEEANRFVLPIVEDQNPPVQDDGYHGTGLREQTPEERSEARSRTPVVNTVLLNKIGLARINARHAAVGLPPLIAGQDATEGKS